MMMDGWLHPRGSQFWRELVMVVSAMGISHGGISIMEGTNHGGISVIEGISHRGN